MENIPFQILSPHFRAYAELTPDLPRCLRALATFQNHSKKDTCLRRTLRGAYATFRACILTSIWLTRTMFFSQRSLTKYPFLSPQELPRAYAQLTRNLTRCLRSLGDYCNRVYFFTVPFYVLSFSVRTIFAYAHNAFTQRSPGHGLSTLMPALTLLR